MATVRQIGMAIGTFSVALGIGFVMQNGDALASRFGADSAPDQPAPFTADEVLSSQATEPTDLSAVFDNSDTQDVSMVLAQATIAPTQMPSISAPEPATSAVLTMPESREMPMQQQAPVQLATLDTDVAVDVETDASTVADLECSPIMDATATQAAMVELSISAPCHANVSFTLHHRGMMFTASTDEDGNAELTVPALAEVAVMIAAFTDGEGAFETAVVPDFSSYDRAVLQWQGDTSVMLSAYEDNAEFGDSGHIFAGNPGDISRINSAEGGYLVRLGDSSVEDALMAEVYTFPSEALGSSSDVVLVAEAEITDQNCGQELSAQSIQFSANGQTSALDLRMLMPDCDAAGDFLILQNMFEDLTLASR